VLEELPAGSSKLDGTVRLALDDYAITLRKAAGLRLKISGHTDMSEAASDAARRKLAQRRAEAVRDYLVKKWGVDAARIEVLAVGAGEPAADNGGAGGRAKNRRVEIVVSPS
jgi:OOP family OmpA-OmpF porin